MRSEEEIVTEGSNSSVPRNPSWTEVSRLCLIVAALSGVVGFMAFPAVEAFLNGMRGVPGTKRAAVVVTASKEGEMAPENRNP